MVQAHAMQIMQVQRCATLLVFRHKTREVATIHSMSDHNSRSACAGPWHRPREEVVSKPCEEVESPRTGSPQMRLGSPRVDLQSNSCSRHVDGGPLGPRASLHGRTNGTAVAVPSDPMAPLTLTNVVDVASRLHHGEPVVRQAAAAALGALGEVAAEHVRELASLIQDVDSGVRKAAAIALGNLGHKAVGHADAASAPININKLPSQADDANVLFVFACSCDWFSIKPLGKSLSVGFPWFSILLAVLCPRHCWLLRSSMTMMTSDSMQQLRSECSKQLPKLHVAMATVASKMHHSKCPCSFRSSFDASLTWLCILRASRRQGLVVLERLLCGECIIVLRTGRRTAKSACPKPCSNVVNAKHSTSPGRCKKEESKHRHQTNRCPCPFEVALGSCDVPSSNMIRVCSYPKINPEL